MREDIALSLLHLVYQLVVGCADVWKSEVNEKCGELVRILIGLPERVRIYLISKLPTSLLPHALKLLDSEYKILIFILLHYGSQ